MSHSLNGVGHLRLVWAPLFDFSGMAKNQGHVFRQKMGREPSEDSNLGLRVHPKHKQAQPEGRTYPRCENRAPLQGRAGGQDRQSELVGVEVPESDGRRIAQGSGGCGSLQSVHSWLPLEATVVWGKYRVHPPEIRTGSVIGT